MSNNLKGIMEAYSSMVSGSQKVEESINESHFKVGDEVKCKRSGMVGKVTKVDDEEKGAYYTVDVDGKSVKYTPDELVKVTMDEAVKTTKQDPLVTVYKNGNIQTHANLSVAAKINGFDAKGLADKVHKAGVEKQIKIGNGLTIELSDQHAKQVKEEVELEEKLSSKEKMARGMYNKKEELDPVNDKENDKKFKDRKDKDIDNDGDVDSSDEYLHKRRAATDDAIDGGKKPAKKEKKGENQHTSDKKAEISKIAEAFEEMWALMQEAVDQKKGATKPEGIMDKESPKSKEFADKHTIEVRDDLEDALVKTTAAGKGGPGPKPRSNDQSANGDRKSEMQNILDILKK